VSKGGHATDGQQPQAVRCYYGKSIWTARNLVFFGLFPTLWAHSRLGGLSWIPLLAFLVLMAVLGRWLPIANRPLPPRVVFPLLAACGALWSYFLEDHSLWHALFTAVVMLALWALAAAASLHWEIHDDVVVERRFFRRKVFPMPEITYIGPMTGAAGQFQYFAKHLLIKNAAGGSMIVDTPQHEAFLAEMRKHLPQVTLNL
jgi:hypothetical protein